MNNDGPVFDLDAHDLHRRSVRGAVIISGAQVAKFVIILTSQVLLARLLNPSDFGVIAMVSPVLGFVVVMADLGISQALVQHKQLTKSQLNSVFWISNALTISLTALLMLAAPLLAWLYRDPKLIPVTIVLASLVAVTGFSLQQTALLNRMMRFSALALSETGAQAINLVVSVGLAFKGFGYWSLVVGQAAYVITGGVIVWSASRWRPSWPSFKSDAASILRFGGNVTISNVALYLNSVLDNVLIGFFLGAALLGLYDRAWKLVVLPLGQLMAPIGRVAVPALSRLSNDSERYRNAFGRMLRLLLFISLPALVVCAVAAKPLISILFGARWSPVAPVFSWLCIGSLLTPVNAATFWIFVSQGRSRDQMIYGTSAALINISAYAAGVHWGLLGVARTSAIVGYLLVTPLLILTASNRGPINRSFILRLLFPFTMGTVGAAITVHAYVNAAHVTTILDLLAVSLVAYLTSFPILACFSSGRATFSDALHLLKRKF